MPKAPAKEPWLMIVPAICLLAMTLLLGVYIPAPLDALLHEAAATFEVP
jgi:NADH:ubiquinone oxidoreductase subunit 5 (subunit L)/multisubunit Na+/H+ antiporter MnhA subunit